MTVESTIDVTDDPTGRLRPGGPHLSFFALDGLRLGRSPGEPERLHLGTCAFCAEQARATAAEPVPLWLYQARLAALAAPVADSRSSRIRWASFSLSSLAVAAAVLVMARPPAPRSTEPARPHPSLSGPAVHQVRAKGQTPAARLYLRRGDEVSVWDGRSPVRPGDRLRLELQPAGYSHVSVAAPAAGGQPPVVLHQGPVVQGDGLLPLSFRVDDQGEREVISVVLGNQTLPAGVHRSPPPGTWQQLLILPKEIAP